MHPSKIMAFLALGSGASSYKIRAFMGEYCTGGAKNLEISDDTCRIDDNLPLTRSFRVMSYGSSLQKASFYSTSVCHPLGPMAEYRADGVNDTFKVGHCITLAFSARAFDSQKIEAKV